MLSTVGFLPEGEMHSRSEGGTPYEMAREDGAYDLEAIQLVAEQASGMDSADIPALTQSLSDKDSAVRYWAAQGMLMRGRAGVSQAEAELRNALNDPSPHVRIVAAEALGRYGPRDALDPSQRRQSHGPLHVAALGAN